MPGGAATGGTSKQRCAMREQGLLYLPCAWGLRARTYDRHVEPILVPQADRLPGFLAVLQQRTCGRLLRALVAFRRHSRPRPALDRRRGPGERGRRAGECARAPRRRERPRAGGFRQPLRLARRLLLRCLHLWSAAVPRLTEATSKVGSRPEGLQTAC